MRKSNKPKINPCPKDDLLTNPEYEPILFGDEFEKRKAQFSKPHRRKHERKSRKHRKKVFDKD